MANSHINISNFSANKSSVASTTFSGSYTKSFTGGSISSAILSQTISVQDSTTDVWGEITLGISYTASTTFGYIIQKNGSDFVVGGTASARTSVSATNTQQTDDLPICIALSFLDSTPGTGEHTYSLKIFPLTTGTVGVNRPASADTTTKVDVLGSIFLMEI